MLKNCLNCDADITNEEGKKFCLDCRPTLIRISSQSRHKKQPQHKKIKKQINTIHRNCLNCNKSISNLCHNRKFCLECSPLIKRIQSSICHSKYFKQNKIKLLKEHKKYREKYREKHGCSYTNSWQKNNRKKVNEYQKKIQRLKKYKDKQSCRRKTFTLLKQRNITVYNQNCETCDRAAEVVHHEDYNNPYDILFLCKKCHGKLHQLKKPD